MAAKQFQLDMSKGSIFKNTIRFAIPLVFASLLQLFYNAADLVVVSRFAGSNAMAAVGATSSLTNLLVNVFIGISLGASVVMARKFGADDKQGMRRTVHTAMLLGVLVGIAAGMIGFFFSRPLLVLMGTPQGAVLDGATLYMKILFLGVPASLTYNFGAAILRAVGDTKRPLYILSASGLVNVALNLILVIFFDMGVAGVAIATSVANYISVIAVILIMTKKEGVVHLRLNKLKLYKKELVEILKIGVPAGVQSSFFSLSNTVLQSTVNSFGEAAIAGNAAASNIEGFIYVAMNAFYQSTLTGVSQNYGAKKEDRINKTIWVNFLCVVAVGLGLGLMVILFSESLLGFYITDSIEAVNYGMQRNMVIGLTYFLCGVMEVLTGALRGLGSSITAAISSFVGTCGFRVFWATTVVAMLHGGIDFLYYCWPISWALVSLAHLITLSIIKPRAIKRMRIG